MAGCGYHFTGGGDLPGNVQVLSIPVFRNLTTETGLEAKLTNDVIFEMTRMGRQITTDPDRADAVLHGVIRQIQIETITRSTGQIASERRATIFADLKLVDKDGKNLWRRNALQATETYQVSDSFEVTGANKKSALEKAAETLSQKINRALTANF